MITDNAINECVCPRCLHSTCPLPNAEPPYDEITQEINNNFISVKVPKCKRKFEKEDQELEEKLSFDFNCADAEGKTRNIPFFLNEEKYTTHIHAHR